MFHFCLFRNKESNAFLTQVFKAFINDETVEIEKIDGYYVTLKSKNRGTLNFWIANRMYAFAIRGCYENKGEITFTWNDEMPSRLSCMLMVVKINKLLSEKLNCKRLNADLFIEYMHVKFQNIVSFLKTIKISTNKNSNLE